MILELMYYFRYSIRKHVASYSLFDYGEEQEEGLDENDQSSRPLPQQRPKKSTYYGAIAGLTDQPREALPNQRENQPSVRRGSVDSTSSAS